MFWGFSSGSAVKNLSAVQEPQEMWVRSLGREDAVEKGMATHSSILAWQVPWTEEPGGLQSMGSQRVGHDWAHSHANLASALRFLSISPSVAFPTFWVSPQPHPFPPSEGPASGRLGSSTAKLQGGFCADGLVPDYSGWGNILMAPPQEWYESGVIHQHTMIKSTHIWSEWSAANGKTQKQDFVFLATCHTLKGFFHLWALLWP